MKHSTFVLLYCWYDGDDNLIDDSFVACGKMAALKARLPEGAQLFMPDQEVPDDGRYGDKRRYRIIETPLLEAEWYPWLRRQPDE